MIFLKFFPINFFWCKIYCCLEESIYDLFYGIYNTINEHNQRRTRIFHRLFQFIWDLFLIELKSSFLNSYASSLIMISMLSLFECIKRFSLITKEEIKLIVIINWIFHMSDFLRLFMVSFKYGLILVKCSSFHSVLFLSPFLSYSV